MTPDQLETLIQITDWRMLLGAFLSPVAVAALVKRFAPSKVKTWANAALATIVAAITVATNEGAVEVETFIAAIVLSIVTAAGSYAGFWKKSGITESIQEKTEDFGIGTATR
jgi:nucleoside permease NupC